MDASPNGASVEVGVLVDQQVISLGTVGTTELSIQAFTFPANDNSVKVDFTEQNDTPGNGVLSDVHSDNNSPYGVQGANNSGKFTASTILGQEGTYTVTAIATKGGASSPPLTLTLFITP